MALYIVGRLKDLIIIRGSNHYPHDIETTVSNSNSHLIPNATVAFGEIVDEVEQVVVVQELKRSALKQDSYLEVYRAIQAEMFAEHGLRAYDIVLVRPGTVPKTTSGKKERKNVKGRYLQGELKHIETLRESQSVDVSEKDIVGTKVVSIENNATPKFMDQHSLNLWFVARLSTQLLVSEDDIEIDVPLKNYGIDSAFAVRLSGALSENLNVKLEPTLLFDYPTINDLSAYLYGLIQNKRTA